MFGLMDFVSLPDSDAPDVAEPPDVDDDDPPDAAPLPPGEGRDKVPIPDAADVRTVTVGRVDDPGPGRVTPLLPADSDLALGFTSLDLLAGAL